MNTFLFKRTLLKDFAESITTDKADSFAKTFVAKAKMHNWEYCLGAYNREEELMGAIICTHSKRSPVIANLQLLHTFAKYRSLGVGKALCNKELEFAIEKEVSYFRVSAEPNAVEFYRKIGFKFWGKQKSGCSLSIFKLQGSDFFSGIYEKEDNIIKSAI